jgi:UDP-N-acetylmuramoyl-tripeptide--D-alanyl-D-alanine ligase
MERLSFEEVRTMLGGADLVADRAGTVQSVTVDSRKVEAGALFFALKGERSDGHDFAASAVSGGAAGVVVEREVELPKPVAVFKVPDTLRALGTMARIYLLRAGPRVIAITGSNGKTTTKEMLYHIMRQKFRTERSEKSFNTEIGVPLTILKARRALEYLILEMGTNARGEIARLVRIAPADMGIITNISRTHLEGLLDIHGVARAKGELLDAMGPEATAVLNHDDQWCAFLSKHTKAKVVWFGVEPECAAYPTDVAFSATGIRFALNGKHPVRLRAPGGHNVGNALAAAAAAMQLGLDGEYIARRLGSFKLPEMRMQRIVVRGVTLINDAYNANEASVVVAADYLNRLESRGKRFFVLGDMLELGAESGRAHRSIGGILGATSIDYIVTAGNAVAETAHEARRLRRGSHTVASYSTLSGAAKFLTANLAKGDVALFKASRGMSFETLLDEVRQGLETGKRADHA